jgi:hypothetical protein
MSAPGDAHYVELASQLRGQIIVDVRGASHTRQQHHGGTGASPVQDLEPNSFRGIVECASGYWNKQRPVR